MSRDIVRSAVLEARCGQPPGDPAVVRAMTAFATLAPVYSMHQPNPATQL